MLQDKSSTREEGTAAGRGRNHQFDLLRIVFAVLVLLSHAPEMIDGNPSREIFHRLTGSEMTFGTLAVDGFFLLSGCLIVQSWQNDPQLWSFLAKRARRILPGYAVAVVLSVVVVGWLAPAAPHFFRGLRGRFVASVLLLGAPETPPVLAGLRPAGVNGSMWTIMYEVRCYLLVALCGVTALLARRLFWLGLTLAMLAAAYVQPLNEALQWHHNKMLTGEPTQIYRLTSAFLVGGCFYLYRRWIVLNRTGAGLAVGCLVLGGVLWKSHLELVVVLAGGYLMFFFARRPLPALNFMRRVPDVSYGVYLYGWPVESLWHYFLGGSPWTMFAGSTVICLALGWLSWHLVERPMLRGRRRKQERG